VIKVLLWIRYLRTRPVVLLSITAVALAVALLIVVASLFTGFIDAFERSATELVGDVLLTSPNRFDHADRLAEALLASGLVKATAAGTQLPGLLHLGTGDVRPVQVWAIEPQALEQVTCIKRWLITHDDNPRIPSPGQHVGPIPALIGIGLLTEPDPVTDRYDRQRAIGQIGQRLVLTCPAIPGKDADGTAQRPGRRTLELAIAGIVHSGNWLFDQQSILVPLKAFQTDQNSPPALVDRVQIRLADGIDARDAVTSITTIWDRFAQQILGWGPYQAAQAEVLPAKELQGRFLAEVRKQLGVLMVIFGVVDMAAVVLVFCVFYMIVRLKIKDIAILKACGCPSSQVAFLFLGLGAVTGSIGAAIGVLLGWLFTHNINHIEDRISALLGIRLWDSSAYLFEQIPNQVAWGAVWVIVGIAILAAAAGALAPAVMAARARPVEVLRYE